MSGLMNIRIRLKIGFMSKLLDFFLRASLINITEAQIQSFLLEILIFHQF